MAIPAFLARLGEEKVLQLQTCISAHFDRKGIFGGAFLPRYIRALVLVLFSLFGMLLWPAWPDRERQAPDNDRGHAHWRGSRPMRDLILETFDNVIKREIAEADAVREEMKRRGTYWAGDEVWKLRRQVKALRERLSEHAGGTQG
jgi:hypothetical protein